MAGSSSTSDLVRVNETLWEIPRAARADMRVPARLFADAELLHDIAADRALEQLQNVATLPGIVEAALAMPDIHQGYGFPVGGVAAMQLPDGVVSPGGVGYDINCGVRLLALPLSEGELGVRRERLVHEISRTVPAGAGRDGRLMLGDDELDSRADRRAARPRRAGHRPARMTSIAPSRRDACRAPTRPPSPSALARAVPDSSAPWAPATTSSSSSGSRRSSIPTPPTPSGCSPAR